MSARTAPLAIFTTNKARQTRFRIVSRSASSFPGPTPHSDEGPGETPPHFGALTESERIETLGKAVLDSGALIFTKCHSGKFTSVNNNFLEAFGLKRSEDIVGKTDDELIESISARLLQIYQPFGKNTMMKSWPRRERTGTFISASLALFG
jgi:PAS domain-containing protein